MKTNREANRREPAGTVVEEIGGEAALSRRRLLTAGAVVTALGVPALARPAVAATMAARVAARPEGARQRRLRAALSAHGPELGPRR